MKSLTKKEIKQLENKIQNFAYSQDKSKKGKERDPIKDLWEAVIMLTDIIQYERACLETVAATLKKMT